MKLICILSTKNAGGSQAKQHCFEIRYFVHSSKVTDFQKNLDLKRWQITSPLKTQFGKKMYVANVYIVSFLKIH